MSDNTTLSTPVGTGDTVRDKDRAGVKTQVVGLDLGIGTGSEALMTGTMPISGSVTTGDLTDAQLRATPVPVSGTVTASGPLTDTQLRATPVPVSGTVTTGGLTDTQLRATPVPVSGTVTTTPPANQSVNLAQVVGTATDVNSGNKSAGTQRVTLATDQVQLTNALKVDGSAVTQPVSGTFFQATQPVSGTVTANAGTGPFPVSDNAGSLTVDAPVATPVFVRLSDGTSAIATLPVSGPVTDTQLRATPVPVSGTVTANLAAGTQNIGDVDVLTLPAISLAGSTNNIGDVDVLTLPGIVGTVAHGSADSGAPVKTGARAISADITAEVANDRTDNLSTLLGKVLVMPYNLPGMTLQGTGNKTDTTDLALIAAQGATVRIYITSIVITNAHATVGTKIVLKSASTIIWRGYADALGGGVSLALPTPLRLALNEACNGAAITTGADVDFTVVGYGAAE